ncbi:MAG TPA: hypothetical protein VFZ34_18415, partial [Blastocatellia bacterium]|nr:hypothetical protein [Blastocatellia bacterium]
IKGYVFSASDVTAKTFTIHAVRAHAGDGFGDFNMTEAGSVYYVANRHTSGQISRGQGTLVRQ